MERLATEKLCPFHEGQSYEIKSTIQLPPKEPWKIQCRRLMIEALEHGKNKMVPHEPAAIGLVTGSGEFPIDMLRYDSCCPLTVADAQQIKQSWLIYSKWEINVARTWRVKRLEGQWFTPRWNSFSVRIVEIDRPV